MFKRKLLMGLALVLILGLAVGAIDTWKALAQGPGGNQPCDQDGRGHGMMHGGWDQQGCSYAGQMHQGRGMMQGGMMGGYGQGYGPGAGMMGGGMMGHMMNGAMMGGYGQGNGPFGPGTGMMNGNGAFGPGAGMMGAWTPPAELAPAGAAVTLDEAQKIAEAYVAAWDDPNLTLGEVLQFEQNFYAQAVEVDSGHSAFEFLIDPANGTVALEPGPNMMWNLRYGMHAAGTTAVAELTVSAEQAQELAQAYLDKLGTGLVASAQPDVFYGYYTFETLKDGQVTGMLSVNGYSGDVWAHHWHGNFITEAE